MNYSTAVMLFNPEIRAVAVSYETDAHGKGKRPYMTFKTLDASIKPGDMVTVPTDTRHNFTVVRVEEVDVEVDYESDTKINWIAGKINISDYSAILSKESEMIEPMKAAEKQHKREEIKNKVQEFYKGSDLSKLALIGNAQAEKGKE